LVLALISLRLRSPFELEWMGGTMLEHVRRVQEGKPLYAEPSADFTAYLYPPVYYWAVAALAKAMPLRLAARLVSVLSALVVAALGYPIARRLGATRSDARLAPLLWLTSYHYLSDWFDLERVDMLFLACVMLGAFLVMVKRAAFTDFFGGALFGLAFFVKQPATLFLLAAVLALLVQRELRRALLVALGGVVVLGALGAYLQYSTNQWFAYYCVKLPAAHGVMMKFFTTFFVQDLGHAPVFAVCTFIVFGHAGRELLGATRARRPIFSERFTFYALCGAGFFASASSRMHLGGYSNVLSFWLAFAAPVTAYCATWLGERAPHARLLLYACAALQAASHAADPNEAVPDDKALAADARLVERVRAYEARGEVYCFGRGSITEKPHAHINAIVDVLRAGAPVPPDMLAAFEQRRFAAFVVNKLEDIDFLFLKLGRDVDLQSAVVRNYFIAEALDHETARAVSGYATAPRYIFLPRKQPLGPLRKGEAVLRLHTEAGLAEARLLREAGGAPPLPPDDIEALAAALLP
jgi:hypothetical protein